MNAQDVIASSRAAHLRELKAEIERLKAENAALRAENEEFRNHFDLALLAARDLEALPPDGRLVLVDGWNLVLGSDKIARTPEELLEKMKEHLDAHPADLVWIVFDGPEENVRTEGRLRVSYTGGTGPHRADRFIVDFVRMARYRGSIDRIDVRTFDKAILKAIARLAKVTPIC